MFVTATLLYKLLLKNFKDPHAINHALAFLATKFVGGLPRFSGPSTQKYCDTASE